MLRKIVAAIYKRISEEGRNEDIQCRLDRSLFRPIFIYLVFTVLLYLKADAGFWQLPFDISANFIRKQPVKRYAIPNIRGRTFLHCRAPPPEFELSDVH